MKKIISVMVVVFLLLNILAVYSYAETCEELIGTKEFEYLTIGGNDTINSYVKMDKTTINSTDYTKIRKSGNYLRSNAVKVEYNSTESGVNRKVHFMIVEHMAFTADEVYEFDLNVGGSYTIHLTHIGNNFTVKAKLLYSGSEKITTTISLYNDITA